MPNDTYRQKEKLLMLCSDIQLPAEMKQEVARTAETLDISPLAAHIEALLSIETAAAAYNAIKDHLGNDPKGIKMLTVELTAAARVRELYAEKGIDDAVYVSTMKCFTRFINEYMTTFGHYGFDRGWWAYRQLAQSIYRLGVLEFEMLEGKLSVHIPSDAVMTREELDRSYAWARQFFARHYRDYRYEGMYCGTWLLSPVLREMLPAGSKILNFQDDYDIVSVNLESESCMNWVFKKEYPDIDSLPEDTTLQRAIKNHLKAGGKIGTASGWVKNRI